MKLPFFPIKLFDARMCLGCRWSQIELSGGVMILLPLGDL